MGLPPCRQAITNPALGIRRNHQESRAANQIPDVVLPVCLKAEWPAYLSAQDRGPSRSSVGAHRCSCHLHHGGTMDRRLEVQSVDGARHVLTARDVTDLNERFRSFRSVTSRAVSPGRASSTVRTSTRCLSIVPPWCRWQLRHCAQTYERLGPGSCAERYAGRSAFKDDCRTTSGI